MIRRICDWCEQEIPDTDLMPTGGHAPHSGLGMEVRTEVVGKFTVAIAVGPIGVDGHYNQHHWHKSCVLKILAEGVPQ